MKHQPKGLGAGEVGQCCRHTYSGGRKALLQSILLGLLKVLLTGRPLRRMEATHHCCPLASLGGDLKSTAAGRTPRQRLGFRSSGLQVATSHHCCLAKHNFFFAVHTNRLSGGLGDEDGSLLHHHHHSPAQPCSASALLLQNAPRAQDELHSAVRSSLALK